MLWLLGFAIIVIFWFIAAKEKLEIVTCLAEAMAKRVGAAPPQFRFFAGAFLAATGGEDRSNYFKYSAQQ